MTSPDSFSVGSPGKTHYIQYKQPKNCLSKLLRSIKGPGILVRAGIWARLYSVGVLPQAESRASV